MSPPPRSDAAAPRAGGAPDRDERGLGENPVLVRVRRGGWIESQHRGAWALVDAAGGVLDGAGDADEPVFARSSVKSIQALPLVESGAAERFGYGDEELALALASHNAEECHVRVVRRVLERLDLGVDDLGCGPQPPGDPQARKALTCAGEPPSRIHNNCSGKHAGFLALAKHLGVPTRRYLDEDSEGQVLVRRAMLHMSGAAEVDVVTATDGCSAPSFRLPLRSLATAIARMANPDGLPQERRRACEWMQAAVARHPVLIAGSHERLCTDLARVTGGRLFPKIGAEGVYVIGERGGGRGLAVKVDDGAPRGLNALVVHLLGRFGMARADELRELERWRETPLRNWAGQEVGTTEVVE